MKLKFNINSNVVKSKNNLEIARKYHHYDNVESIHVTANEDVYHIDAVVSVFNHPQKCSLDIKDNQVISYECSCPFNDQDSMCGHLGAVILKLNELEINELPFDYQSDKLQKIKEIEKENQRQTRESKLVKLNAKINGTGLFKKPNEKLNTEANNLILEIKQLYIELDRNKIKEKIFQEINENSTVFDALKLASSYYTYVYYCIQDNIKEITEEEIEQLIKELREFVNWPDYTILDNITLLNEKDVMVIIKDRYQLLKINITKEDLDKDNLNGVIDALEKIKMNQNLLKNNINIDELESECEFGKILKSK